MKLRNKKTGEIGTPRVDYQEFYIDTENGYTYNYKSLQRMYEEWEDCKGPKGIIKLEKSIYPACVYIDYATEEEAEKGLEKLKAWKRLQDKGVKLEIVTIGHKKYLEPTAEDDKTFDEVKELIKDFELIFGDEE